MLTCAVDGDLCVLFPPTLSDNTNRKSDTAHPERKDDALFLWNDKDGYFGYRDGDDAMIYLMPEEALELHDRRGDISFRPFPPNPPRHRLTVYRHFRALGFIVRDGLGYGVDYMLYREPPGQSHALHGLLILPQDQNTLSNSSLSIEQSTLPNSMLPGSMLLNSILPNDNKTGILPMMTWRTLHGLARCIFSTKKTLVVAVYDAVSDSVVSTQLVTRFHTNHH